MMLHRRTSRSVRTVVVLLAVSLAVLAGVSDSFAADRPNILWITSEDNGPHLGCYGDEYADSPNIDGLAAKGMLYLHAWSTAPVCAPARTTIISGLYPPSTGSEHMRSMTRLPAGMKMYPEYLREAGYFCTNHTKEDYNLQKPKGLWDVSGRRAHWRQRAPGQPFFAIFNFTTSHESQIRKRPHKAVHDPAKVPVPAYHPDHPAVRQDWAQYYDKITEMDRQVGGVLRELREDGLEDDTIIFYYGDHGAGMPRGKRWPYNSGLRVPLVVHVPEKFRELAPKEYKVGGKSERLVGFIDLAPTALSVAGIEPPAWMQGSAFFGKHETPAPPYQFGFRGRMDERYDMVRVVRDRRYLYIRNYMPHKIYGQHINYMFQTPTTRIWKELYDKGELAPPRTFFWERKPPEELYDLEKDPDEVRNLAGSAEHAEILARLRGVQRQWELDIRDVGFLPEGEIHSRAVGSTPYEMGHEESKYPLERILAAAELASGLKADARQELVALLKSDESAVRYWGALGILMREGSAVRASEDALVAALGDSSLYVRAIAAEALGVYGEEKHAKRCLDVLIDLADIERHGPFVSMLALNAVDAMGERAAPIRERIRALPRKSAKSPPRVGGYSGRLIQTILANLDG